jgi:hypothetical protein
MSETWYMVVGLLLILSTIVGWGFILYNLVSFAITGISESQRKIEVRFIVLIKAFGLYVLLGVLLATPIWLVEIVPAKRAVVHTERNDGVRVAQSFQSATIMWQWDWEAATRRFRTGLCRNTIVGTRYGRNAIRFARAIRMQVIAGREYETRISQ